jgi:hypothetical protein
MQHRYGEFTDEQISQTKIKIRKSIFFILLCCDPTTNERYADVDVNKAFLDLLYKLGGMNDILFYPAELVTVISLLQRALHEYNSPTFDFDVCRKLLLDAGSEIMKVKEVFPID